MSDNIRVKFYAALADMENPTKDSENPHFKSRYASLGAVMGIVKQGLAKHGLVPYQHVNCLPDGLWVLETEVIGADGDRLVVDRRPFSFQGTPQQNGSEETYLRRYALMCCMGLSAEDDDANDATKGAEDKQDKMIANLRKVYRAWRDRSGLSDEEAQVMCLNWIGKPISKDLTAAEVNTLLDYMRG